VMVRGSVPPTPPQQITFVLTLHGTFIVNWDLLQNKGE
jgi:hypothetical protein